LATLSRGRRWSWESQLRTRWSPQLLLRGSLWRSSTPISSSCLLQMDSPRLRRTTISLRTMIFQSGTESERRLRGRTSKIISRNTKASHHKENSLASLY
jgi:hypothetical protein